MSIVACIAERCGDPGYLPLGRGVMRLIFMSETLMTDKLLRIAPAA